MKKVIVTICVILMLAGVTIAALVDGGTVVEGEIIEFAWDANTESDLAGYRIYRSSTQGTYTYGSANAEYEVACNGEDTSMLCTSWSTDQTPVGTWYWVITAYNLYGNESTPSENELKKTVVAYNPPPVAPVNFRFEVTP